MKPKLMRTDYDKMEDNLMFFFTNDDPSRQLQGCLVKNTMIQNNATKFIYLKQTSGKRMTKVEAFDQNNNLLDTGHYLNDDESKKTTININSLLENLINESTG